MKRFGRLGGAAVLAVAALAMLVFAGPSAGHDKDGDKDGARSEKAILFASDGMRPDLMERYAGMGIMPTFKDLMRKGVTGRNGLLQGFPPNTGVGWHTLATGTWPGEHGSTNNTFHRTGDAFNNTSSFAQTGILQGRRARPGSGAAGAGRRLPDVHRRSRHHAQLRPAGAARVGEQLRGPVPEAGAYERGGLVECADLA